MAQYIKKASIFGRIGENLGRGLAEQLPQEIERSRLASGLSSFEREHENLNPMQQLARLSAIPGITPQMIQSFSDLAKINNKGNAFRRAAGMSPGIDQGEPSFRSSPDLSEVKQANLLDQAANAGLPMQHEFNPSYNPDKPSGNQIPTNDQVKNDKKLTHEDPLLSGRSQLGNFSLADPRALTKFPWTPNQRKVSIVGYMQQGFTPEQAQELAADDEARDLATASVVQKQQEEKETRERKAEDILTKQLETRLQKSGEGVYKDITGDMLADLKRAMSKAVVENPNASAEDIAEDFSKRALRLAKTKKEVEGLGETTGIESVFTGDKVLNKLRSYQKVFEESGNQEEYYNILRGKFGLSPQGAAMVAFPATKNVKRFVDDYKPNNIRWGKYGAMPDPEKILNNSRKAALDVEKIIDSDDSLLSIARMLSERDPHFDQRVFFEQLSKDLKNSRLTDRQKSELGLGEKDILPTWGDIKILPWFGRSTK